jgi:hypothetical protein
MRDLTIVVTIKALLLFRRMFSLKIVRNYSISRRNWRHSEIVSFSHRNELLSHTA